MVVCVVLFSFETVTEKGAESLAANVPLPA
jgi:hypothetical protein